MIKENKLFYETTLIRKNKKVSGYPHTESGVWSDFNSLTCAVYRTGHDEKIDFVFVE